MFPINKNENPNKKTLLADFHASGQTQKVWCAVNNIKVKTLQYWLRRERETTGKAEGKNSHSWCSVQMKEAFPEKETSSQTPAELIVHYGSYRVELHQKSDLDFFCRVLHVLEQL